MRMVGDLKMNTEQILLEKWRVLSPEKQQEILEVLDRAYGQEMEKQAVASTQTQTEEEEVISFQPKTERGKKFWELRQKNIASNPNLKLLDWDDIEAELDEIRGRKRLNEIRERNSETD